MRPVPAWISLPQGSFLYGLSTSASDEDYDVVYVTPSVELACGLSTPSPSFESHANKAFASDKVRGVCVGGGRRHFAAHVGSACLHGNPTPTGKQFN